MISTCSTLSCNCGEISNHGLNHGLFLSKWVSEWALIFIFFFRYLLSFSKCEWFCECCSSFFPKNTIVVRQKSEHSLQICTVVPRSYTTPSSNAMLFWIGSKKTLVKLFSSQLCYFFPPVTLFSFSFSPQLRTFTT